MWEVSTHVSDPNKSISCTNAMKILLRPLVCRPPVPESSSAVSSSSEPSKCSLPLPSSRCPPPSRPAPEFEGGNRLNWSAIGLKGLLCALPHLLFRNPPFLSFRPLGGEMSPVQRPTGHHHVTPRAPGVGEVAFLQYNHSVPDIPV